MPLDRANDRPTTATVLLSGGVDSCALAHLFLKKGFLVEGVFVDYGQAARLPEWNAVQKIAAHLSIPVRRVECGPATFGAGELAGRNMFLVSAAIFLASAKIGLLALGVHAGTGYYDCSSVFINQMSRLVEEQSGGTLALTAPFVDWRKPQIFSYFQSAGLPLDHTYSCESGSIPPCKSCASCRDRKELGC